ncbi:MAG TPA: LLM class flavin-dependent oxidoreductase [Beijerinckiaceae bacterium]|jgi:alkanesulfonate monooxygenase SsuD/methylene tetrahydromethanopterin reductase-like flavin-dependent oxidoreductase (luciferase family)|nr:LLM class flavin-dependent oxidoreductase [Beijerinckiaceae bacterium]
MRFSIYSELQHHGDKPYAQLYHEVLEQIEHAERVGFDVYTVIEHWFFPQFSISANPWALFGMAAERTSRIHFRTLGHPLPYHNPAVLASQIAQFDILSGGRYEFGVVRGHGWIPTKAGLDPRTTRDLYEESLEILFLALEQERFSYAGKHYQVEDSHIVPRLPEGRRPRVFLGGTSDRTYELAGENGWCVAVPPLLPYEALKDQLDIYREFCAKHGNEPYIVWIHAAYIDEDRETARREAERGMRGFLTGNASPLLAGNELPPNEVLQEAGFGFYAAGILEKLAATPYDEMLSGDVVWVGTPDDVAERIEAVIEKCEGVKEIAITTNAGGFEHWKAIKAQQLFAETVIPRFRAEQQAPLEVTA